MQDFPNQPKLAWLASSIDSYGIDIDELDLTVDQRNWLTNADADANSKSFSLDDYLDILNKCAAFAPDGEIGLHLANHLNDRELGVLGYILCNVCSVADFLVLATRYHMALSWLTAAHFDKGRKHSRFTYEVRAPIKQSPKQDVTLTLSRRVKFIRDCIGDDWRPEVVCFSFDEPENVEAYTQRFGSNVLFNQAADFFEINNKYLSIAVNDSDQRLLRIISAYADELLNKSNRADDILKQVKIQLVSRLGKTDATQETIARTLNMSRATFQRRLAERGKSFRQIRDEVVYQLSTSALIESDAAISQIAFELGFSELSSFDHGFSRLSGGLTPKEFRKRFRVC